MCLGWLTPRAFPQVSNSACPGQATRPHLLPRLQRLRAESLEGKGEGSAVRGVGPDASPMVVCGARSGEITAPEWSFLVRGVTGVVDASGKAQQRPSWLSEVRSSTSPGWQCKRGDCRGLADKGGRKLCGLVSTRPEPSDRSTLRLRRAGGVDVAAVRRRDSGVPGGPQGERVRPAGGRVGEVGGRGGAAHGAAARGVAGAAAASSFREAPRGGRPRLPSFRRLLCPLTRSEGCGALSLGRESSSKPVMACCLHGACRTRLAGRWASCCCSRCSERRRSSLAVGR